MALPALGDRLFYHCANAKTASLPATLTSIGDSAFAQEDAVINDTAGLTSVTIPQAVTAIQSYAFYHTAIAEVTVPASVKTWGKYVFSGCAKLKTARVACDSIGAFAFTRCTALSSLTISANCRTFGENMLTYCESLTAITYEGNDRSVERHHQTGQLDVLRRTFLQRLSEKDPVCRRLFGI